MKNTHLIPPIFPPSTENHYLIHHIKCVLKSYHHWTGKYFYGYRRATEEIAKEIYNAPFVLVSHGTQADPIFNYANLVSQKLWEMTWEEITSLPSKNSAEPESLEERQRLLDEVTQKGFIDNYSGIRISKTGRRFKVENAIVWNLLDSQNQPYGQAACFFKWEFI